MPETERKQFSVVVAEDESRILKNIAGLVEESGLGFKVVSTAADGLTALELVEKLRPHLLITDIRMPRATGLEILKRIREQQLPTQCLIISSFDYFQYAREALRYGAREYLLKPVTRKQMEQSLREILIVLNQNEPEGAFNLDMALTGLPQRFPEEFSRWLLLLVHCGNVMFFQNEEDSFPEWASRLLTAELRASQAPLREMRLYLSSGRERRYRYLLLGYNAAFDAEGYAKGLYEKLSAASAGEPVYLWTGRADSPADLKSLAERLYHETRRLSVFAASIYRNLSGGASGGSREEQYNKYALYAEKIPHALGQRDLAGLKIILKDMIRYWKDSGCPTETMLNMVKYQYLNTGKILASPLRLEWESGLEKVFSLSANWDVLYEGLLGMFTSLLSDQAILEHAEDMMRLIDEYICGHYAEHITNQTLSRRFGFVPSYISKLFRDYKGLSPCEYLTQVRIERAQKLIEDSPDSSMYHIARAVGFQDASYFTRLFKRQTGMLPTEYREAGQVKKDESPVPPEYPESAVETSHVKINDQRFL
jgi:AraC-like DNA-binding protein/CheY-like chemotaxis protein